MQRTSKENRKNQKQVDLLTWRNQKDLESIVEALSAVASKEAIVELYRTATNEPQSFWYLDLVAKDPNKMFFKNLSQRLLLHTPDAGAHK